MYVQKLLDCIMSVVVLMSAYLCCMYMVSVCVCVCVCVCALVHKLCVFMCSHVHAICSHDWLLCVDCEC